MKDQVLETDMVDLFEKALEDKKKKKVALNRETTKARREVVTELVPKSGEGPGLGSKERKENSERELTREERNEILRTQKVLSSRVFDSKVLPKPGMCDFLQMLLSYNHGHTFLLALSHTYMNPK